jgi:curved DNA-binding protein CbpA
MPRTYDKDPYVILGIPPTATASQVKQAYRRLAREYHPDLNKDLRAIERMKDINWANDILSDAQERSLYDLWRNSSVRVVYYPGSNNPPSNATPPRSSNPPTNQPPSNPPPRTTYSTSREAQGCTTTIAFIIIVVLMNMTRMIKPVSQPSFNYSMGSATLTALEDLISTMETFRASQKISTRIGTVTPSPFYKTHFDPSPTAAVLRDEFGHEDLRPRIVPSSQEWEWINTYFPDLTTPEGLSDEVTFVFWDQTQRAFIIKTRQSGVFIISTYGGNITAGHYGPVVPTPTATVMMDEFGHADLRPSIVPGSWEWGQIHHYFPDLTTPDGLSDEVTLVIYDQLRGYQIKTRNSGDYWLFINVYDNSIAPAHFTSTAAVTPTP